MMPKAIVQDFKAIEVEQDYRYLAVCFLGAALQCFAHLPEQLPPLLPKPVSVSIWSISIFGPRLARFCAAFCASCAACARANWGPNACGYLSARSAGFTT